MLSLGSVSQYQLFILKPRRLDFDPSVTDVGSREVGMATGHQRRQKHGHGSE